MDKQKELQDKINLLEAQIKKEQAHLNHLIATHVFGIRPKCEYCGCPEGIHKSNCKFIIKFCS